MKLPRNLLLPVIALLGACGHASSQAGAASSTTPACETEPTSTLAAAPTAGEPVVVESACSALGTRTSHDGVEVSVVGVQIVTPFVAEPVVADEGTDEDAFRPFTSFEPGTTFALRVHSRDALVDVGDLLVTSLVTERGERIEDVAHFPEVSSEVSEARHDALVYSRIGGVAQAGSSCLGLDGTLRVRLGSGTSSATSRINVREGATFEIAGIPFEVTRVEFESGEDLPFEVELETSGELNRIRTMSFSHQGASLRAERTDRSAMRLNGGPVEMSVTYAFDRRLSTIDVDATLVGEVREIEVPVHLGIGVGLVAE